MNNKVVNLQFATLCLCASFSVTLAIFWNVCDAYRVISNRSLSIVIIEQSTWWWNDFMREKRSSPPDEPETVPVRPVRIRYAARANLSEVTVPDSDEHRAPAPRGRADPAALSLSITYNLVELKIYIYIEHSSCTLTLKYLQV